MRQRCLNKKSKDYKNYGGREIKICTEWLDNFETFRIWALNNGYKEGLQIGRINNDGNYEPNNCKFMTSKESGRNTRTVKLNMEIANEIRRAYDTGSYTQQELANIWGVHRVNISCIITYKSWA